MLISRVDTVTILVCRICKVSIMRRRVRADLQWVRLFRMQEVAVAGFRDALGLGHAGAGQEATLRSIGNGHRGPGALGLSHGLS